MPDSTPPRVMILADGQKDEVRGELDGLQAIVEKHLSVVGVSVDFATDLTDWDAELAIVMGGDGSILRAAHQMGHQQRPVIGVNLGRLGFLADLQPEQLDRVLPQVAARQHQVIKHLMFEWNVAGASTTTPPTLGLNEVAVLAGPPFSILEVQLYVDGILVTTYSCDGLIVSSPIGSTAHSLSAGGPILRKNLQAFVISPISPHTLTNRPVVDTADRTYEIVVPHPQEGTSLVVDGQLQKPLKAGDRVRIVRSQATFQMVEVAGQGYYRTLREKLGWGGQLKPSS